MITAAGLFLFRDQAEHWYRAGDVECGEREFLIQDPDGYLLRFSSGPGEGPARAEAPPLPPFSSFPLLLLVLLPSLSSGARWSPCSASTPFPRGR